MKRRTAKQPKKRAKVSWQTLHVLWREIIFERARYRCEYPGCTVNAKYMNPHHVLSKRHLVTKYDPDNGLCLCTRHHTGGDEAVHAGAVDFWDRIFSADVRTREWYEELRRRANTVIKAKDYDREGQKLYLERMLKEVKYHAA